MPIFSIHWMLTFFLLHLESMFRLQSASYSPPYWRILCFIGPNMPKDSYRKRLLNGDRNQIISYFQPTSSFKPYTLITLRCVGVNRFSVPCLYCILFEKPIALPCSKICCAVARTYGKSDNCSLCDIIVDYSEVCEQLVYKITHQIIHGLCAEHLSLSLQENIYICLLRPGLILSFKIQTSHVICLRLFFRTENCRSSYFLLAQQQIYTYRKGCWFK